MKKISSEAVWELREKIQEERPLVHCITNIVTVNDCANILLAAGASPTMAHHPLEAAEVTEGCRSLVCNLGATESLEAMLAAGLRACEIGHPIVLDPVGVSGSSWRRRECLELIGKIHPSCIRGNYSEIRALASDRKTAAGVDALRQDESPGSMAELVGDFAAKLHTVVIASGAVDLVSDGHDVLGIKNGSPWMTRITGSGCMFSALLGAFLAVENSAEAAGAASAFMGICGEAAAEKTERLCAGAGSFHMYFLDAVSVLEYKEVEKRLCVL